MDIQMNEEIVFDDVVNEVSITSDEQHGKTTPISHTESANSNVTQYVVKTPSVSSQPKPIAPKLVRTGIDRNASASINIGSQSPTVVRSPTITVNNSPGMGQMLTKLIMTGSGQQLLISSPVKQDKQSTNSTTPINIVQSNVDNANASQAQQLMAVIQGSPAKAKTKQTPLIRPKPSPSSGTSNICPIAISSTPSTPTDSKPQQFQIIRLITANASPGSPQHMNLKPLVSGSQQKLIIPAGQLKSGQFLTTSGTQQLIMVTPSTPAKSASATGISASTLTPRSSTNYVPILPSPSTPSNSNAERINKPLTNGANTSSRSVTVQEDILSVATAAALSSSQAPANRPRKPCNCTRSQCLKLYCDCFANGEFCSNCNCINCSNNLGHEEERQKAIKQCLERNPHAFHPKIGKGRTTAQEGVERRHTKGCNCRRSGCLKNYCECYEAKILCSDLCKCCACKNYEDSYERKTLLHMTDANESRNSHSHAPVTATSSSALGVGSSSFSGKENEPLWGGDFRPKLPVSAAVGERLLPCQMISGQVLNATAQCLLAQMDQARSQELDEDQTERILLEEFGRCLMQIIKTSKKKENEKS